MTTPVLSCSGVVKHFGTLEVLRGIDLDVAEHEVVALIGASGSGKSTLLRCINLLETVTDGVIRLDGRDITDPRVDHGRGAPAHRDRLPVVQPLPAHDRAPQRDTRATQGPWRGATGSGVASA